MTVDIEGEKTVATSASVETDGKRLSLTNGLPYAIRDVHRGFTRSLQNKIASHGISMGQWYFLRALWEEDGLTQRELSQRAGMMEPTTVTALNILERLNIVQRVRNPHDRRKMNIYLTNKGRALRRELLDCASNVADQACRGISTDELARALSVLQRLNINLSECNSVFIGNTDDDL